MAYEPKGKMVRLFAAMNAPPERPVWDLDEASKVMGISRSAVPAYLKTALDKGALFRRLDAGLVQISLQPFPAPSAAQDIRVPKFGDFVPPKMVATRAGSEHHRSRTSKPPVLCPGCSKTECWDGGCQKYKEYEQKLCPGCTRPICEEKGCVAGTAATVITPSAASPAPAPTPAPSPAPAPTPAPSPAPTPGPAPLPALPNYEQHLEEEEAGDLVEAEGEEEAEAIQPDAFISCRTGEIVLVGCPMDEEGRVTVPADLVQSIRRQIAWSAAR